MFYIITFPNIVDTPVIPLFLFPYLMDFCISTILLMPIFKPPAFKFGFIIFTIALVFLFFSYLLYSNACILFSSIVTNTVITNIHCFLFLPAITISTMVIYFTASYNGMCSVSISVLLLLCFGRNGTSFSVVQHKMSSITCQNHYPGH